MPVNKLTRSDFVASLAAKKVDVAQARSNPKLAGLDFAKADLDRDGQIRGAAEADALFKEVDRFDRDGNSQSLALLGADGVQTRPGAFVDELGRVATADAGAPLLADAALKKGFATAGTLPLTRGKNGDAALALQYGLARLGFSQSLVDGKFGPNTEAAVKAFQSAAGLPATGTVDARTLGVLDAKLATTDLRTPAEKSADPLAFLSNFSALGMARMAPLTDRTKPANWSHPEIQKRYGEFVGAYWEVCKQNRVEADCKTLSMFLMDQFRAKAKADLGINLPKPGTSAGKIPEKPWVAATATATGGFFSRFETLAKVRPGYESAQAIQKLDPKASMLTGTNVRYGGVDANMASRGVKVTIPWDAARENGGDQTIPEVPVEKLQAGDVMFIDHTGDGRVDHMFNVVRVERDAQGVAKRVVLATGSFDDMKDADGSTAPNSLGEVNNYSEEVTVDLDARGRITNSRVTWSSEPGWLAAPRYSARTLLMELKPGGRIDVGRWGQPV